MVIVLLSSYPSCPQRTEVKNSTSKLGYHPSILKYRLAPLPSTSSTRTFQMVVDGLLLIFAAVVLVVHVVLDLIQGAIPKGVLDARPYLLDSSIIVHPDGLGQLVLHLLPTIREDSWQGILKVRGPALNVLLDCLDILHGDLVDQLGV